MFRTVSLSNFRSLQLYSQQQVYDIQVMLCVHLMMNRETLRNM